MGMFDSDIVPAYHNLDDGSPPPPRKTQTSGLFAAFIGLYALVFLTLLAGQALVAYHERELTGPILVRAIQLTTLPILPLFLALGFLFRSVRRLERRIGELEQKSTK